IPEDVHPFFQLELAGIRGALDGLADIESLVARDWLRLKRLGLSDADIAGASGSTETAVRQRRRDCGVRPAYRRVDSCAGEVEAASNYYYSTWGEADEPVSSGGKATAARANFPDGQRPPGEPVSGGGKATAARANFPDGQRPPGGAAPTGNRPRVVILGSGP